MPFTVPLTSDDIQKVQADHIWESSPLLQDRSFTISVTHLKGDSAICASHESSHIIIE